MLALLAACAWSPEAPIARPAVGPPAAKARTLTVDCAGAGEFLDLVSAIDAADSGDTIEVAPCTYTGSIDFRGREVRIVSTGGAAETFIVATPETPVVRAARGEGPGTLLEGFTLVGGGGVDEPAVEEQFSALTLRDVTITGSAGTVTVYARSAMITLDRVWIDATNTPSEGLLIQGRRGMVAVKDSVIECGAAPIGYMAEHGAGFLDGVTFSCPDARAAEVFHCPGRVQRSTFDGQFYVENESASEETTVVEGSVFLGGLEAYFASVEVHNAVFWGAGVTTRSANVSVDGSIFAGAVCALDKQGAGGSLQVEYSLFHDNQANHCAGADPVGQGDNLAGDPLFVDAAALDFTLGAGSPAIDAGPPGASWLDVDGSPNDIGAWGGPFRLGGGW